MSGSIPPVRISYVVDGVDRVVQANGRVKATVEAAGKAADTAAIGFRRAGEATGPWAKGLTSLENAEIQAAQATRALAASVDPLMAKLATVNSGTEKWATGLRALEAQQVAAAAAVETTATAVGAFLASLGPLILLLAAFKAARFVESNLEAAEALNQLSQKSGATVETLSVLKFAGDRAGVTFEDLTVGFKGLALSLGQLRDGGKEATAAFAAIGLSSRELAGLSTDQAFQRIADALGQLPAGFDRAEAAVRIFGRSGSALIPLLDDLAKNGFAATAREAEKFGAVVSTQAARDADEFTDRLGDLKNALGGVARDLGTLAIPAITRFLNLIESALGPVKKLAELIGSIPPDFLRGTLPGGLNFFVPDPTPPRPESTVSPSRALGHAAAPFIPNAADKKALEDEIQALATIREAEKLSEVQQTRIREIVKDLTVENQKLTEEYSAQGTTERRQTEIVVRQATILQDITSLTKSLDKGANSRAEAEKSAALWLAEQAQELEKILQATSTLEEKAVNKKVADLVHQQLTVVQPLSGTEPLTLSEQAARRTDAITAKFHQDILQIQADADKTSLAFQNIGQSIREGLAGNLVDFLTNGIERLGQTTVTTEVVVDDMGHVVKDQFGNTVEQVTRDVFTLGDAFVELARTVIKSIRDIVAQLLAAQIVKGLSASLLGGIPKAPGGLDLQDVGQLAKSAPDFGKAAATAASAAALTTAAVTAGTTLTAAGVSTGAAVATGAVTAGGTLAAAGAVVAAEIVAGATAAAAIMQASSLTTNLLNATATTAASGGIFHSGGIVGGSGEVNITALAGEAVINREATAANYDLLAAINDGFRPVAPQSYRPARYHSGGIVQGGGTHTVVLEAPDGWKGTVQSDDDFVKLVVKNRRAIGPVLRHGA